MKIKGQNYHFMYSKKSLMLPIKCVSIDMYDPTPDSSS